MTNASKRREVRRQLPPDFFLGAPLATITRTGDPELRKKGKASK